MTTHAIIIGAGRGSRLTPDTDARPKCLVDGLGGRTILDWTLEAFRHSGIDEITFIGGYRIDDVREAHPELRFVHNKRWAENNVLESLMCAQREMQSTKGSGDFLVSYSDTVFRANVVQRLVSSKAPLAIVVDRDWRRRYVGRTDHPESEAEKVIIRDGHVVEIGKHIAPADAHGEFTGLARFSARTAEMLVVAYQEAIAAARGREDVAFHRAPTLRKAYLTDMLQELIQRGVPIAIVDIWGDWVEIDTGQDLALARELLGTGRGAPDGVARDFWAVRARDYEALEWVRRDDYLGRVIAALDPRPDDRVLDVGTGTGIVAHALAPRVAEVIGVDLSIDMLRQAIEHRLPNETFEEGDARRLHFPDDWFDKVVARMVFHHLMPDPVAAMRECHRVVKPGGLMVLSEGVPPNPALKDWYAQMFALKEDRLTFLDQDLEDLLEMGGFAPVQLERHVTPQVSIGNWLKKSGLPARTQRQIYQMHLDLDEAGKRAYRMAVTANPPDIRCDFTFVIAVGRKVA
jgi:choline kinase/ubiquinone/menaquinone biosynthesis C-methylase UbiE